jgi:transcriptional regulator with XRE-family HTH domain
MNNKDTVDRIIELREFLGYKQYQMSEKLGLKQSSLSDIERRKTKKVTEQMIMLICEKFNVNEEWLKTGHGEMFIETQENIISELTKQYNLDELDQRIIIEFAKLNEQQRKSVKDYIYRVVNVEPLKEEHISKDKIILKESDNSNKEELDEVSYVARGGNKGTVQIPKTKKEKIQKLTKELNEKTTLPDWL